MTAGRKWLFRLIAIIFIPLFLLGGLEIVLRLAGYGYSTNIFKEMRIGNETFLVNNDDFSLRFFSPQMARFPGPIRMAVKKPPATYRIFILGESAAMGDPAPTYGAGRYLEALLSARYPRAHFEIINLGITAIDSHVILPIARDCAARDADLWIIYMGNNEMVGPFGAATVFGAKAPPLTLVRLNLAIQETRIGQLLNNVSRQLTPSNTKVASWGGMEMFMGNQLPADDPRREMVYRNFSKNLDDIVRTGLNSGAKILLNTVVVNLKDCAPFSSMTSRNLSASDQVQFDNLFTNGVQAENHSNFLEAARDFQKAAALDPKVADLQFHWARNLLLLSNYPAAQDHFQLACDYDALPFRADSRINGIIRNEPKKFAGSNLVFLDAAAVLDVGARNQILGQELFYEHVHFNFDGNYRLARAWAEQIGKVLPDSILRNAGTNSWADQSVCEQRLGLTDWNRSLVIESVRQRLLQPPLSDQLNNDERIRKMTHRINQLHSQMDPAAAAKAVESFKIVLEQRPDDYSLRENFALFLEAIGDSSSAVREWQRIHDLIPQDSFTCFQLGRLLDVQGQFAGAEEWLHKAVTIRPTVTDAWIELGDALIAQQKFESALMAYKTARQQRPGDSQIVFLIGKDLMKLNRQAEAIQAYRDAIKLDPSAWQLHFELGGALDAAGQEEAALLEFAAAVRLNPNYSRTHFNYGVLLAKLNRLDDAQREFEESLKLEPGYQNALNGLAKIQILKRQNQN